MNVSFLELEKKCQIAYVKTQVTATETNLPGIIFFGGFNSDMEGTKALALENWAKKSGRGFLRFDYTGHGKSSGDFLLGSILSWSKDALAVLDHLTAGPQILVGSSMGGWIALLVAKLRQDRVHSLIGIASAPDFTEDSFWFNFSEYQKAELEQNGYVETCPENLSVSYKISKALIFESRKALILRDELKLSFPVRLLQGSDDHEVSPSLALKLLNHIESPDLDLLILKGAGHSFSDDRCIKLIVEKIEELSVL